jgi:hypothetical protein
MKKFTLFALAFGIVVLGACQGESETQITTIDELMTTETTETTFPQISLDPPPTTRNPNEITFAPEDMELDSKYLGFEKRLIYITIFSGANDLFPVPYAYDVLADEQYAQYGRRSHSWAPEMCLVTLVKRYDVPRVKFEEAVKKAAEQLIAEGRDLSDEYWELPNTDILYTFNNDIIDAYYRRENPVEPDWTTLRTYESYSAYLAANPE